MKDSEFTTPTMPDPFAAIGDAPPRPRAAYVKVKLKGQPDGPIYQGAAIVIPCASCGGRLTGDPEREALR